MAAELMSRDLDTNFCSFIFDSWDSDGELLPTMKTAGKDHLSVVESCCMGSLAIGIDGTVKVLNGLNKWVEYVSGLKGEQGIQGEPGKNGATWKPKVTEEGLLSWSKDDSDEIPQETNIKGADGKNGDPGKGVATGGTTGQILSKSSETDYETKWIDAPVSGTVLPEGGTEGQVLSKAAEGLSWSDPVPGANGKDGGTYAPHVDPDSGELTWTLNGEPDADPVVIKGADGQPGQKGEAGANGINVVSITLNKDASGAIVSGSAHMSDESDITITVSVLES